MSADGIALIAVLAIAFAACAKAPAPASSLPTTEIPPASSASAASSASPKRASHCPIHPLKLVVEPPGGKPPAVMMTLAADGTVTVSSFGMGSVSAKLDGKGCLAGADGLWAEHTPSGKLWTAHERYQIEGGAIEVGEGTLKLRADGKWDRIARDGSTTSSAIALEGYREDAACAGFVLLAAFFAMMPSMAVSDGRPAKAPVPDDSTCGEYSRSQ